MSQTPKQNRTQNDSQHDIWNEVCDGLDKVNEACDTFNQQLEQCNKQLFDAVEAMKQ